MKKAKKTKFQVTFPPNFAAEMLIEKIRAAHTTGRPPTNYEIVFAALEAAGLVVDAAAAKSTTSAA